MKTRIERETATVALMIKEYCRAHHAAYPACAPCRELMDYAAEKLRCCPFGEGKTVCSRCPVHCYKPEMRKRIRTVMRYAGPRMIYCHPLMAVRHMLDLRRRAPQRRTKTRP